MPDRVSIRAAIWRGTWTVNIPVFLIMCAGFFIIGLPLAWLYWSYMIPRWKLWAYARVDNPWALKVAAVKAGLIWPDGHMFEKTEICSKAMRHKINRLEWRDITYRALAASDEALLRRWLNMPHVKQWWGDPELALREALSHFDERPIQVLVFAVDDVPLGYIRVYRTAGEAHFDDLPSDARGIDIYIGEPDHVGKGTGTRVIADFSGRLLAFDARPEVITALDPENRRAIRAFEKAGFAIHREVEDDKLGRLLLMARRS
jgi:aminoglycoside 6'-N-acetyltransferase